MTASYTQSLRLTLQGDGDNPTTWGDVTNDQVIELIEAGVCGVAQVTITGSSNVNIATTTENGAPDTARNMVLQLVGTLGANIQLTVPAVPKMYLIDGLWSGPYTVTIVPVGGSGGVVLTSGVKIVVYISGTTITQVAESAPVGSLLAANNLSDLNNVATALTNLGLGTMAQQNANNVNITGGNISGVTGLSSVTSVAGRTGAVVLSNTDISGLGALALLNSINQATGGHTVTLGTAGSIVFSGGLTVQWGPCTTSPGGTSNNFPTAFSAIPYMVWGSDPIGNTVWPSSQWSASAAVGQGGNGSGGSEAGFFIAIGPT
jgi:hypothetical protein